MTTGSVKTFTCPSCGGTITIRAAGISINAVCQSCGSIIDVANENLKIIRTAAVQIKRTLIPLGSRGELKGITWEAIGYTGLSDETGHYTWAEYLLFNPYYGFRFLVEADGHWSFVKMLRQHIPGAGTASTLTLNDSKYRIYTRGQAVVQYVLGEFYWRVKVHDRYKVADYVAPPYMLSMESSDGEIVWSLGEYIESETINKAFVGAAKVPLSSGVAPNQPAPGQAYYGALIKLTWIFLGVLLVIQLCLGNLAKSDVIYERHMDITPATKGQMVIADPIVIPGGRGNLKITGYSYVDNNWVDLYGSLVSDATQESDDFILPIAYYHGWDSDGNWTEGSQSAHTLLSGVKGGSYRLLVETDAGAFIRGGNADFDIKVIRNVPMWLNFWAAFSFIILWPMCMMIGRSSFETRRWAASDFPPAKK